MNHRLRELSHRIGRVPPLVFMVMYMSIIPIYALLYWNFCEGGFYAPYAHLEPSWRDRISDKHYIIDRALNAQSLSSQSMGTFETTDLLTTNGDELRFTITLIVDPNLMARNAGTEVDEEGVALLRHYESKEPKIVVPFVTLSAKLSLQDPKVSLNCFYKHCNTFSVISVEGEDDQLQLALMERKTGKIFNKVVRFTEAEKQDLWSIHNEFYGVGGSINSFWRMLYLSTVIVTTLGLGDIVPMSQIARLFVGSEAIAGIFLGGLFLNALSHNIYDRLSNEIRE